MVELSLAACISYPLITLKRGVVVLCLNTYSQSSEFFSIKPLEEHRGASFVTCARTHSKQARAYKPETKTTRYWFQDYKICAAQV